MVTVAGADCPNCGRLNGPRAGFCGHCGGALEAPTANMPSGGFSVPGQATGSRHERRAAGPSAPHTPPPGQARQAPGGDFEQGERPGNTTRLLGAAAHLDADLAEAFIDEFLVEPRRCIPRSPGVDAASVLGDAAASHRRRQWRDGILVLLAVVVLVTFPLFALGWLVVGGIVATVRGSGGGVRSTTAAVGAIVIGFIGFVLVSGVIAVVTAFHRFSSLGVSSSVAPTESAVTIGGVMGVLAMLAVVVVILGDRLLVVALIRRHFAPHRFRAEPDPDPVGLVASLRTMGRDRFATPLQRTREAEAGGAVDGLADVVVFRGPQPFVGAGDLVERHALVVPLEPEEGGGRPTKLSERELHDAVSEGMDALRRRSSLSPHRRLRDLRSHEQVLVAAHDLVANTASPEGRTYLSRGPGAAPIPRIPLDAARHGAVDPREWARYYRCHYVEGWERDLTVSCYVTLGTDGHLLYLEWVTCALTPLDNSYRAVDDHHALQSDAWGKGFLDVLSFPASLPARIGRVFRSFRPILTAPGQLSPAQFGALTTLREMAAGGSTGDYFRTVDVRRYSNLFDRTVLEAVRTYLAAHGLKIADFDRVASSVINIDSVNNSVIAAGAGARADGARAGGAGSQGKNA